jgi:hypothetical protein
MNQGNLYLYLARRDKKGIKIISIFPGNGDYPYTRLTDIKTMNLSSKLTGNISNTIYTNRMLWEPWVEGADDYKTLRESLRKRGYSNIPLCGTGLHSDTSVAIVKNEKEKRIIKTPNNPRFVKTMLRRKR